MKPDDLRARTILSKIDSTTDFEEQVRILTRCLNQDRAEFVDFLANEQKPLLTKALRKFRK